MNGNSDSSNGHSWDVPSSTGLDRDDCVILGHLPIDFDAATNGVLKEGSPVALPMELLDGIAKKWPNDYMALLSALMHQSPENAWLGDKGKSLFLRWRIGEDWVGARIHAWKEHPGELAVIDFFGDASDSNPRSNWVLRLIAHKACSLQPDDLIIVSTNGSMDGRWARFPGSFPPLGGNPV